MAPYGLLPLVPLKSASLISVDDKAVMVTELDVAVGATINQARPSEPYLLPQLVASLTGVVEDLSAAAL